MQTQLDTLAELAKAAFTEPADKESLALAARILRETTEASEVLIVYAEEESLLTCRDAAEGIDAEISQKGLAFVQRGVVHFGGPVAFRLNGHRVEDFITAYTDEEREFLAFPLPTTEAASEMCILRGPWEQSQRRSVVHFMESAVPALTLLLERIVNAERGHRQRQQLQTLANAAQVLTQSEDMESALAGLATAIAASSGFDFASIDVYDAATDHFTSRVINEARWSGGSLAAFWRSTLNPDTPDAPYLEAVTSRKPVLLLDLQNDERVPEPIREFFKRSLLTSAGMFPMLFQDEPMGVMAVTSYRPHTFPPEEIVYLQGLAAQAATALKAMRTHSELIASQNRLRQYAQRIERQRTELRQRAEKLRQMASTDALTGVHNYGHLHETIDRQVAHAQHSGTSLALILADVDDFKFYNDTYGHLAGDHALKSIAEALVSGCRPTDLVGRYGGDEFMIILPETDRGGALTVAERIVDQIAELNLQPDPQSDPIPLQLAIGIAIYPDDGSTKDQLIAHADAALYESKSRTSAEKKITLAHEQEEDEVVRYPTSAFGVLDALVRAVDRKDHYTKRHSEREAEYAVLMGEALKLSSQSQRALRIAGLLHDLGKIGIPDRLLRKPGPLTEEERGVMQQHVILTERIIGGVPHLADVLSAASHHHERYDGQGYPRGLKGQDIPLLGRILAIADAYSAMTLDRPYRKAISRAAAIRELRRHSGSQFDPELVEIFVNEVIPRIEAQWAKAA